MNKDIPSEIDDKIASYGMRVEATVPNIVVY
jgi:hypothetical protein